MKWAVLIIACLTVAAWFLSRRAAPNHHIETKRDDRIRVLEKGYLRQERDAGEKINVRAGSGLATFTISPEGSNILTAEDARLAVKHPDIQTSEPNRIRVYLKDGTLVADIPYYQMSGVYRIGDVRMTVDRLK